MKIRRFEGRWKVLFTGAFFIIAILAGCRSGISPENAAKGEQLFNSSGCNKCHSLKGENMYGPSLKFIPGNEVSVIREGKKVSAIIDRNYIIRSIKQPDIEKVEGYENKKMTPVNLTSKQIGLITDYLIFINTNAAREQSQ